MSLRWAGPILLALMLPVMPAYAQTAPAGAAGGAYQPLAMSTNLALPPDHEAGAFSGLPAGPGSSQDQFQRFQQRQQQLDMLPPPENDTTILNPNQPEARSASCVVVRDLTISGADHLQKTVMLAIAQRYQGRCLGVTELNHALDDINGAYLAKGFVTSRAYLPEQSLQSGRLQIIVVEGKIEGFSFDGIASRHHELTAFPGLRDHILNLQDLEQGLEQMNRLPGWTAKMQIVPGTQKGRSVVKIHQHSPGIIHGQVWVDNNGQYETGHETGHALLRAEDVLGLLDLWSVEYDHSMVGDAGNRGTQYISANGSIPFGAWTVFGGWWMSQDVYHLQTLGADYRMGGKRQDFRIGISRVVTRNKIGVTTVQAFYELKSFSSTLDHVRLQTQSARQAYFVGQASESLKALGGLWYLTLGVRVALPGAGTHSIFGNPSADDPHTQYFKPTLDIDGYKALPHRLMWHVSVHGEYSTQNQFTTDQMQIGGPYTVRGFLQGMLLGNEGVYIRNEFSWPLASAGMRTHCGAYSGFCRLFVEGSEVYGILDGGMTRAGYHSTSLPPSLRGGEIAGSGIGLRKTAGSIFWNMNFSHAIAQATLVNEGWIAAFQTGVRF
jgi:hemolysin activation/secretion protein